MTLGLSKLPWHVQLGLVAAFALGGVGAFWNFYVVPTQASIDARQQNLQVLQAQVARGEAEARSLPQLKQKVKDREAELIRMRAMLPEEKDVADLLRKIQAMATQSNLVIRGFTPQAVANKQMYAEWPIGLQLEGNYHNLGDFLERVSKFDRIINVTAFKIRTKDKQTTSTTIAADCTATTFVLTEPALPPSGTSPAAAPRTE
ncbi:MAG: type 4a pilus biogenesis protein PilO [Vicinamibacterales bacterium]